MKEIHKFVLAGVLCGASCLFTYAQELYKNENAPVHERVADLLSRLTVEEKISLLRATSPGIPRLGIDKYYHGNEALHGVVRPGRFTVFPQAIGLAATWNPVLQQKVATVISDEARARWNDYMAAWQDVFARTSTEQAPWYLVPADNRWYSRAVVSELLRNVLKNMNMIWPPLEVDADEMRRQLETL